jgi:hypothetical protein
LGYQSSAAIAVTQTYLDSLPSGADVTDQTVHPAGTVVRDAGTGAMWVIGAGVRLPATALAVAASYRASEIVTATAGDEALPLGAPYQVRDGSLVAASDGGAPWLVEGGMKHRFADAFLFASMGYTNAMLLSAAPTDLNAIPTGAPYGTVPTPGISLFGDWNHGGADTLGVVRDNLVSLRYTNTTGPPDVFFTYGLSGDRFIAGDWNGGGVDTVGVIRGNTIYLRNSNTSGVADQVFQFGSAGDQFIVGDWNGDGVDTIGVIRGNTIYLRNSNTSGVADQVFQFGSAGDRYIVGDWNGDGVDTLGVVRGNTVYLRDSNSTGVADVTFSYGVPADTFVAGDWNGDGQDTVGVVRGNVYYLRNTNTTGAADTVLVSAM